MQYRVFQYSHRNLYHGSYQLIAVRNSDNGQNLPTFVGRAKFINIEHRVDRHGATAHYEGHMCSYYVSVKIG